MRNNEEWAAQFFETNKPIFLLYLDIFGSKSVNLVIASLIFVSILTVYLSYHCHSEVIGSIIFMASISGIVFIIGELKKLKIIIQTPHSDSDLNKEEIIRLLVKSRERILGLYEWWKSTFVRTSPENLAIIATIILGLLIVFNNTPFYVILYTCIAIITSLLILTSYWLSRHMEKA